MNFDTYKVISRYDINLAQWTLSKNNHVLFSQEGQEPTFTLPPAQGGTYQLKLTLHLKDDLMLSGQTSLNVVQDTPVQIKLPKTTDIEISAINNSPEFAAKVMSQGAEIYSKDGWKKVPVATSSKGQLKIEINKNETVPTYNNQMIIRVQGAEQELGSYGSVAVPVYMLPRGGAGMLKHE